ncbi:MAG: AI-2E family transporter [Candidatus Aminicenantes bacterium]|nr:AI-2E family transporter [Candidatus Aminicenantes bacterium]
MTDETRDLRAIKLFVGFITTVIAVIILKALASIFLPLCMALLLYFLFNGMVKKFVQWKIPRFIVLIFLLFSIFILFYFLGTLIYSSAASFVEKFPAYSERVLGMIKSASEKLKIPIGQVENYISGIDWTKSLDSITAVLSGTFGSFAAFVGNLLLVLVYLIFMLAGGESMTGRIDKAFAPEQSTRIKRIISDIESQVRQYLSIKTFISLLNGTIAGIILFIAGVDFVIFSALLVSLLNFIPNIGSVIATMFPVLICFLQYGFSLRLLLVLVGLMVTQFTIGNAVEPRITGKSLDLSPIVILISLIFWGYIWGIVGMILAVPLTSAIKIFCGNIPTLKPIADLISAD